MVPNGDRPILLSKDCPVRQILDLVRDKWIPPVLYTLCSGTRRYNDFQRQIPGVSKKMLTQTLRQLESDGIVERTVYPVVPPKVEYKLTPFGEKLIEPISVLADWAWQHQEELKLIHERRTSLSIVT
ncbi:MAG: helix-turn-helix transcriptional regulator [Cyanomargarita calcarea GSE-NOS-MK-12-04C]|jgi:DNA-binding HxlR family transcriptional regulator|uniref:Helix-turn-helix transcriptional regulator n=1 Tax=Cyanomargarita calcarea GSE-NOS-MK-12-04C TaxID=2839659 RepID=A0A951QJZ8_9CYAN|nr:helix-turn-helix transcriptional regulator [Cyanomargarita calcarea GSE-NOS-MK-12-04C]